MKSSYRNNPAAFIRRLFYCAALSAVAGYLIAASHPNGGEKKAAVEEKEFSETPAELVFDNLPASENIPPAMQPRSVPALGRDKEPDLSTTPRPWTALGPFPIPNGQTSNRVDPVSGRTTVIAISPTSADVAYVGTAQGGLYRTLNGGATWTQLMDNAASPAVGAPLAIGSVTIDPADPTTLFVGTGEGNLSGDSFFGTGLYTITNANSASPIVNGPFNTSATDGSDVFIGRSIVAIAVDPTNDNNVFVSTSSGISGIRSSVNSVRARRGLYRSTNARSASPTWTRLQVPGTTNLDTISPSLVMEPGNPNNLIVAFIGQVATDPNGIYRSTDALAASPTFTQSLVLPLAFPQNNAKLAISKVGSAVTVYATTAENTTSASAQGKLYQSTDGGASFVNKPAANGFAGGQGFYDIAVGADPTNGNRVAIGGNTGANIFRSSTDGGTTFISSTTGLHADVHAIAFAPSNSVVVYHGNDGGIWRSQDSGANWTALNNTTFSATQFSGIALHPTDRNFTLGGTQDNGTEQIQPSGNFFRVDFGDGGFSLIDRNATDTTTVTMYHTYFNQTSNLIGTARVLTNPCATEGQWAFRGVFAGAADPTPVCDGSPGEILNGILLTDATNFYAPMVLGPGNPNTWYFGTDKLYRSINRADAATAVSQLLDQTTAGTPPTGTPVSTIAISPQDDNVRLVGLNNGKIFATTTGNSALLQIAGPGATNGPTNTPASGNVTSGATIGVGRIFIDPNNKNVAYFAFTGFGTSAAPIAHVYKVTNLDVLNAVPAGMVVFTPVSNGLPDIPANALAIDPQSGSVSSNSSDIYVGMDNGVYASGDGGATWNVYGTGFPHVSVFGLEIQSPSRLIRAATHGRGMYENFVTANNTAAPLLSKVVSRLTHGAAGTFDVNMPLSGPVGIESRRGGSNGTLNGAGNFTIVLTFTNPIVSGNASVTSANGGTVSGVSFNGGDMIVNLTGVTNAQRLALNASGVTDTNGNTVGSTTVNLGFLIGDTSTDSAVNGGDAIQTRNNAGKMVDVTTFRTDVNTDGLINSGDASIVRSQSGSALP